MYCLESTFTLPPSQTCGNSTTKFCNLFPITSDTGLSCQTHTYKLCRQIWKCPIFFLEVSNPTGTIRHPSILEEAGVMIIGVHSNATSPLLTTTDRTCTKFNKSPWRIARAPHKEASRIFFYRTDKAVESYYMELSTYIWGKSFPLALRDDFKIPHKNKQKANKFLRKLFLSVCLL